MKNKQEIINRVHKLHENLGRRPKKRDDGNLHNLAKRTFGSWNSLMKVAGYDVKFYQKIKDVPLNEDVAYFIGLVVTDGHIVYNKIKKRYMVAVYTSFLEEKTMLIDFIRKNFGYSPNFRSRIYGFSKNPNYEIRINSKRLVEVFVDEFGLIAGPKSLITDIPLAIKESKNPLIKASFLRGVIDGDGSVLRESIKIASGSKILLHELKDMFKEFGIYSGRIIKDNKKTNTYAIRICRKDDLAMLNSILYPKEDCFCYVRKKEKFKTNRFKYKSEIGILNPRLAQIH